MIEFGAWLQQELRRRDWSPADFSRRSGINRSMVSRWLDGEVEPSPKTAERIADGLGVHVERVYEVMGILASEDDIKPGDARYDVIAAIRRLDPDDSDNQFWLRQMALTLTKLKKQDAKRRPR